MGRAELMLSVTAPDPDDYEQLQPGQAVVAFWALPAVHAGDLKTLMDSGFGGQVDFVRGASRAKNGRPVIALPSTAKGGKVSRIVPVLAEGAGVVTTRADVRYVVTEHGVAQLFGKSLRERARALIGIAHPQFRDELTAEARKRNLL